MLAYVHMDLLHRSWNEPETPKRVTAAHKEQRNSRWWLSFTMLGRAVQQKGCTVGRNKKFSGKFSL